VPGRAAERLTASLSRRSLVPHVLHVPQVWVENPFNRRAPALENF
jgi:hypothetical protein